MNPTTVTIEYLPVGGGPPSISQALATHKPRSALTPWVRGSRGKGGPADDACPMGKDGKEGRTRD
jgi:hypothetical protein